MNDLSFFHEITVDAHHYNFPDIISVQKDTLRGWIATPVANGALIKLQPTDEVELWSIAEAQKAPTKTNGSIENGKMILPVSAEMLHSGKVSQQIVLKRESGYIRFPAIRLLVDAAIDDAGADTEQGQGMWKKLYDQLNAAVAALDTYKAEAQLAVSQAQQHEEQARACREQSCTCATESQKSATAAGQSAAGVKADKEAAAKSATDAATSAAAAKTSETNAKTSETGAANSAADASQSKAAAKASADSAKTNADNAANSATKAGAQATTATNKAAEAAASATAAAGSKDAAALSAQAADAKAALAFGSANNAERASNSAGVAATAAFDNANDAKASADKAKASETNAASSASTAQGIADNLQGTVTAAENATTRANTAAERAEQASQTVQPDATKTRKGIVQIGDGIDVNGGKISVNLAPYAIDTAVKDSLTTKANKVHKHSTEDINGLDAALAEAGKVKSVNGQTGAVTIAAVPSGGTAGQVLKKTSTGYDWGTDNDTQPDLTPYAKKADVTADLDKKVDKVSGKGLSTNDFTDAAKQKVDAIPSDPKYTDTTYKLADGQNAGISLNNYTSAEKTKLAGVEEHANKYTLPTASDSILGGIKVGANLSIAADGTINATDTTYNPATPTSPGLMSAADKTKVDAIGSSSEAPSVLDKSSVWAGMESVAARLDGLTLKTMTQAEYDALSTKDTKTVYLIYEQV